MKTVLLPAYLEQNDLWVHFATVVQQITQEPLEKVNRYISWIRHQYITEGAANTKIEEGVMLSQDDLSNWDLDILIQQAALQGFDFKNARILTASDYLRIYRNLPQYWFQSGVENFIDFFSFVLNTPFTMVNLWTENYSYFLPEGDSGIGTPVYQGGTWYPTTHVQLQYDSTRYGGFTVDDIVAFFYYFANYNLVLHTLISESEIDFPDVDLIMAWGETVMFQIETDLTDPTDHSIPDTELMLLELPVLYQVTTSVCTEAGSTAVPGLAVPGCAIPRVAAQVATPAFSPPAGSYVGAQDVTITTTTAGATLHYTTDGSTLTSGSPVYSTPVHVAASETLKAIGLKLGYINSSVGVAAYVIS